MRRLSRQLWPGLLVVAAAWAALGAGRWHTVDTEHYEVSTDVSPAFTELVARHMEAIHREYALRFRGYGLKVHGRFQVKVYAREDDYELAVPPSLRGSHGAFVSKDRLLAAFKGDRTDEAVFRTLYHEGFHQFLFSSVSPEVPLWLNEGFAEYFAEATWNGRHFTTGQVPWIRLHVLREAFADGSYIPLRELFRMGNKQWLAHLREDEDEDQGPLLYCEAWSVVHFLLHAQGGRYRQRALGYLRLVADGMDHEAAFVKSFGSNVEGFEQAWRRYVMELEPDRDDVCAKNMGALAFLALEYYKDLDRFTSVEGLRRELMDNERVRWRMTTADGEVISGQDRRRVAALFKCPCDRSRSATSYVLLRNLRTGLPEIYCTHHPGIVLKAYYVRDEEGKIRTQVERIVRETLPPELARMLRRRTR